MIWRKPLTTTLPHLALTFHVSYLITNISMIETVRPELSSSAMSSAENAYI